MRFFLTGLLFIISLHAMAGVAQADSVGVEEVNGKSYILHKVEEKETLYSLSRRYNVSIYQIIENNPPAEFGLTIGEIVRVPVVKRTQIAKNDTSSPSYVSVEEKIHVVKPKETVFSISRMYNVSIEDLKRWNNLTDNLLEIDQKLIVKEKIEKSNTDPVKAPVSRGGKTHIVASGETLYAISRKYNITIDELRSWNELIGNEIGIGQELIVGREESPTIFESASLKEPVDTTSDPKLTEPVSKNDVIKTSEEPVTRPLAEQGNNTRPVVGEKAITIERGSTTFEEVEESGLAELIDGSENTRKYLALHRTAKIGTIMRVRNEMNDQEVFVRVLGRLPDTGVNKNVLIKVSKSAYDRLGAIDPRFRVSVSYIP
ncbi:LysM peptidoglycan-binding domain-containing protein [Fulvivirga imtechensis]|nr:LysM peptidoglycan-binding domain-containing protein [Fulvivirga imtechensis]